MFTVFDLESNGLRGVADKCWCICYTDLNSDLEEIGSGSIPLPDTEKVKEFFRKETTFVGHNIIRFDIPLIRDLYGLTQEVEVVDTLGLSWYLYPNLLKHGLEEHGVRFGIPKPVIEDWDSLTVEEYVYRCEEDVKINTQLFKEQLAYLKIIYSGDTERIFNLINYLNFKLDCALEQENNPLKIDVESAEDSLEKLEQLKFEKEDALIASMPAHVTFKTVNKPAKMYTVKGDLTKAGQAWESLLVAEGLGPETESVVVEKSREPGKPTSSTQIKNWLYALGWEPCTFEARKNKQGDIKNVPQIYAGDGVAPSIKKLFDIEPALENLDMLSLINHRIGVLKTFLSKADDKGCVQATVAGFTNTLRFRHNKPIANLPSPKKFYGKEIRGLLIKPDDEHVVCGSDMSALEDTTKQHYMYFYDPEYVEQMRVPGFDPHLDVAVLSGLMTKAEELEYKRIKKLLDNKEPVTDEELITFKSLDKKRANAKTVNFAGIYGASPAKLAETTGLTLPFAKKLHQTYWNRNQSVKLVAKHSIRKTTVFNGEEQMWLYNPVSKFWYSLRYEKDIFSTLNQGTGDNYLITNQLRLII